MTAADPIMTLLTESFIGDLDNERKREGEKNIGDK